MKLSFSWKTPILLNIRFIQIVDASSTIIHGWVIRAERIVQDIAIGEGIDEKKILSEMAVFAKASPVRENSIQPLKIVVIFSSDRI